MILAVFFSAVLFRLYKIRILFTRCAVAEDIPYPRTKINRWRCFSEWCKPFNVFVVKKLWTVLGLWTWWVLSWDGDCWYLLLETPSNQRDLKVSARRIERMSVCMYVINTNITKFYFYLTFCLRTDWINEFFIKIEKIHIDLLISHRNHRSTDHIPRDVLFSIDP